MNLEREEVEEEKIMIECPHCTAKTRVFHMAWDAIVCLCCGEEITKQDIEKSSTTNPKKENV